MRSCFVHPVVYNIMVKTKFNLDVIWIRLIILFFVFYSGDVTADVDHLHVKKSLISEFLLYSYRGYLIKSFFMCTVIGKQKKAHYDLCVWSGFISLFLKKNREKHNYRRTANQK
jgi:hypothetical protein